MRKTAAAVLLLFLSGILFCAPVTADDDFKQLEAKALACYNKRDYQQALTLMRKMLAAQPGDKVIKGNIAQIFISIGFEAIERKDFAAMTDNFNKALEYSPDNKSVKSTVRAGQAVVLQKEGYYKKAFDASGEAYRLATNSQFARQLYLDIAQYYAFELLRSGDVEEGLELMEGCLRIDPKYAQSYETLGFMNYEINRFDQAIASLSKAIKLDPRRESNLSKFIEKMKRESKVESKFLKTERGHFSIYFPGYPVYDYVTKVTYLLEEARDTIGYDFGYIPKNTIPVIVYIGDQFHKATESTGMTQGLYDGKVRISEQDIKKGDYLLKRVVFHEYAHAVINKVISEKAPVWLHEGYSQYFEPENSAELKNTVNALKRFFNSGNNFSLDFVDHCLSARPDEQSVVFGYQASKMFFAFLMNTYEKLSMKSFLKKLKDGMGWKEALYKTYFKDCATLERDFQQYIIEY